MRKTFIFTSKKSSEASLIADSVMNLNAPGSDKQILVSLFKDIARLSVRIDHPDGEKTREISIKEVKEELGVVIDEIESDKAEIIEVSTLISWLLIKIQFLNLTYSLHFNLNSSLITLKI